MQQVEVMDDEPTPSLLILPVIYLNVSCRLLYELLLNVQMFDEKRELNIKDGAKGHRRTFLM